MRFEFSRQRSESIRLGFDSIWQRFDSIRQRFDSIRLGTLAPILCGAVFFLTVGRSAEAQEELPAPRTAMPDRSGLVTDLLTCKSSDKLLRKLTELVKQDQLWLLGDGNLAWTTMAIPGWRWEAANRDGGKTILAIEDEMLVAIYESKYAGIRMSVMNASRSVSEHAAPKPFAPKHVTAMSVKHFSNKSPELFKIYYRFAGPTAEIVSSKALPVPDWAIAP